MLVILRYCYNIKNVTVSSKYIVTFCAFQNKSAPEDETAKLKRELEHSKVVYVYSHCNLKII